jgi:dUTP pyrophosphatase
VALHNDTDVEKVVQPGDRIAQIILIPYIPMLFEEVESLENTERGNNGFGSTGK